MECSKISTWECDDGEVARVVSRKLLSARGRHTCCECGKVINPGERYERCTLAYDGAIDGYKTCTSCLTLRMAFFDAWTFGRVWGDFCNYVADRCGEGIKWSALSLLDELAKGLAFGHIETVWNKVEEGGGNVKA